MDGKQVGFYTWHCLWCGHYAQRGEHDFVRHLEQCLAELDFEAFEAAASWGE